MSMQLPLGVKDVGTSPMTPAAGSREDNCSETVAVLRRLEKAWLPVRNGKVHFQETLFALARCQAGRKLPECTLRATLDKQARRWLDLRHLQGTPVLWNAHEYYAATILQRLFRGFHDREALLAGKQKKIKQQRVSTAFHISSTLLTSFVVSEVDACSATLAHEQYLDDVYEDDDYEELHE